MVKLNDHEVGTTGYGLMGKQHATPSHTSTSKH